MRDIRLKPNKVTFYGFFGQGNLGNESTLQAILYHLQQYFPNVDVNCICTGPEDVAAIYNISAYTVNEVMPKSGLFSKYRLTRLLQKVFIGIPWELYQWLKALRILKGTDMLIVPGTGFLTDAYSDAFGWPYDIFKWSLMAKVRRCKLIYVSIGAGPIYRPLSGWFIKSALSLADFRSYRDNSTKQCIKGIGLPADNDRIYPDLAFNLPKAVIPEGDIRKRHRPVVGIGLMSYAGKLSVAKPSNDIYLAYLEKLVVFVKWLLDHEYDIRLLIGDVMHDRHVTQEFRELLGKDLLTCYDGRVIDEPAFSVEQLLSQLSSTDLVVATRFHNVLLSLILNKPVISISFHHKCDSLMSEMGLSEYCQNINNLDVDMLIETFCDLEENAEKLKPMIKQKTEEFSMALDEQYSLIFKDVFSR